MVRFLKHADRGGLVVCMKKIIGRCKSHLSYLYSSRVSPMTFGYKNSCSLLENKYQLYNLFFLQLDIMFNFLHAH